ncbi:hypothetical protein K4A83_05720 [Spirulina subsalsa FACHB-351]|uniref:Uncharacterized protein n=1 Tax=Spirulina subsalsa FACHB-351 TaxID=234711 RepID=A0ABT3L3K7_9CYAN|nr:hypothetical protein [Spirulina subsalsa]MCW6035772.1 hypothetical protein [Spirulina subsalsa FACHB-351]
MIESQEYGRFRLEIHQGGQVYIEFLPTEERYFLGQGLGNFAAPISESISVHVLETVCSYLDAIEVTDLPRESLWNIYQEALQVQADTADFAN